MNNSVSFGFGFVSCLAIVGCGLLSFVLFCPVWQEWTNKEVEVKVQIEPAQIYFMDIPRETVNFPEELPNNLPNILPKSD